MRLELLLVAGLLLLAWVCASSAPVKLFDVADFGAKPGQSDSGPALREAIQAAIAAKVPAKVVFHEGTYRLAPAGKGGACLPVNEAKDLTLEGVPGKTKLLLTNPKSGCFSLTGCENCRVEHFEVDYDPVPYTQGVIVAVHPDEACYDVKLDEGFPTFDEWFFQNLSKPYGKWGMIFDRRERHLKAGAPDVIFTDDYAHLEGRIWRIITPPSQKGNLKFVEVGDRCVQLARGGPPVVGFVGCKNSGLRDIIVHAGPGLASLVMASEGIVIDKLRVTFPPDSNRLLTTDADGVHCPQNIKGPLIENCLFEGMADDAVNIYYPPNLVKKVLSPTEVVVTVGGLIFPGDELAVFQTRTGKILGRMKALAVERYEGRLGKVTFSAPVEGIVAGEDKSNSDCLFNMSRCGRGYVIRNNTMRYFRRYGVLVRAGHGLIEHNTFEGTSGNGVVITNEPGWPEGPVDSDIIIRNNTFIDGSYCRGYADSGHNGVITVRTLKWGGLADEPFPRKVVIEYNHFINPRGPVVYVGASSDVKILHNDERGAPEAPFYRPLGLIVAEKAAGLVVEDFTAEDPRANVVAAIELRRGVPEGSAGLVADHLHLQLSPEAVPIRDLR